MKKVIVYYSVENGGDGSAYPRWYEQADDAEIAQESASEGWGESCTGTVETYEGSNVHREAVAKSNDVCCGHCYSEMEIGVWRSRRGICEKCKGE